MGWCDDPRSKKYNKLIYLPFNYGHEKLFKKENTYDIILVLNYNMDPIRKNKGSAIFMHITKGNYEPTKGCIALKKNCLLNILKSLSPKDKIKIKSYLDALRSKIYPEDRIIEKIISDFCFSTFMWSNIPSSKVVGLSSLI